MGEERQILECLVSYGRSKKTFWFTSSLTENLWDRLCNEIKQEFDDLLQDVETDSIEITFKSGQRIRRQEEFETFVSSIPEDDNGIKHIEFKRDFSAYRKFSQLEPILGVKACDFTQLPDLRLPLAVNTEPYEGAICHAMKQIQLILNTSGVIDICNEMERSVFVDTILRGIVSTFDKKQKVKLHLEFMVTGPYGKGRTDFTINCECTILCVTESKRFDLEYGFCQNLIQLQSACKENIRKRKRDDQEEDVEYVYGIVSTGDKWYFTMVTSNNEVAARSMQPISLNLSTIEVDETQLKSETQKLFATIRAMLDDKIASISEPSAKKKQRLEKLLNYPYMKDYYYYGSTEYDKLKAMNGGEITASRRLKKTTRIGRTHFENVRNHLATNAVKNFLENYAEIHGLPSPGRNVNRITQSLTLLPAETSYKSVYRDFIAEHLVKAKLERNYYNKNTKLAEQQRNIGKQAVYNKSLRKVHLFGIQDEAVRDEDEIIGKGPNGTLSLIFDGIKRLNKVICGYYESIELNFMVDGSFGLVKKLYRKTMVNCVNDIVEVVKKSSTTGLNKAQRYDSGKGFQYLDFNSVLGIFFKKLSGLQKYQHFVFEAANPEVVKAQMVVNDAFTEFNLLKTRKANVSEITKEIPS
ncbi:5355_t:CDS:10 [Ambispora leptoticha]|uniref:5355_t:CDS:1 n=1 Tax=Ambispora leptoticha TaxID=144679 RepID=A0A9N9FWQ1_9GLOM|nr:5355_t:CDS:10 [Ambispora leptoticha]